MILSSRSAKVMALLAACVAHAGLGIAFVGQEPVEIEGAAGASEVMLGSAFADMAAGTVTAEQVTDQAEPVVPDADVSPQATPVAAARDVPEAADRVEPSETSDSAPKEALAEAAQPTEAAEKAPVETAVEAPDVVPMMPEQSETVEFAALAPVVAASPVERAEAAQPEKEVLTPAAPAASAERIEATEPDSAAAATSLRPKKRSEDFEERHKPQPEPQKTARSEPKPKAPAPVSQGNSNANARAGITSGTETATARSSGQAGTSAEQGNAARSNYPGQVMRRLSRIPRPKVNARGTATIAFSIANNGGLSGVSLARSSGSAHLDQAALRLVQSAAPFPAPPSGAQRSFSIQIKGR